MTIDKENYDIVTKALELACEELNNACIDIIDKNMVYHKAHGLLVGYFLMQAKEAISGNID